MEQRIPKSNVDQRARLEGGGVRRDIYIERK